MPRLAATPWRSSTHTTCTRTDGIFQAFEEKRAHAFIGLYDRFFEQPNAAANVAYIREAAASTKVPVSLMLDHGASFEQCIRAISLGFTDVMFDGSKLPLEENISADEARRARRPRRRRGG